jgi:hypothetical protein
VGAAIAFVSLMVLTVVVATAAVSVALLSQMV